MQAKCKQLEVCKHCTGRAGTTAGSLKPQTNNMRRFYQFIDWADNSTAGNVLGLILLALVFIVLWIATP